MRKKAGFTVIELVVVVAVLLILVILSAGAVASFGKEGAVKTSVQSISTALTEARTRTLASENAAQYGVYVSVGSSTVVLFRGAAYTSADQNNTIFSLDPRVRIATTTRGTTTSVIFTRLSGTTTPVTITVEHMKDTTATSSVVVQQTGLINVVQ